MSIDLRAWVRSVSRDADFDRFLCGTQSFEENAIAVIEALINRLNRPIGEPYQWDLEVKVPPTPGTKPYRDFLLRIQAGLRRGVNIDKLVREEIATLNEFLAAQAAEEKP